ncbi:hypothetical protein [Leptospira sp. GIMC2001]|uniref:hypothetical protein n=1 Tax=Leptospira sp. GIMC2001 TaxID=1513297 RepID=UPI00234A65A8|nr:hypothetical protein [Leptospira sp. GIMC2001]WCL51504.1 hypothetical protein O4O04_20015 [Leptospira sp. GIMC2001]
MDFKQLIEKQFEEQGLEKYEFLSSIFEITTYDDELEKLLVDEVCEVIEVLLEQRNFEYIKDPDNYLKFIRALNSFFLRDKIQWGTSIRGAWIEAEGCQIDFFPKFTTTEHFQEFLKELIVFWRSK